MEWTGGCLCGAVRFEVTGPPDEVATDPAAEQAAAKAAAGPFAPSAADAAASQAPEPAEAGEAEPPAPAVPAATARNGLIHAGKPHPTRPRTPNRLSGPRQKTKMSAISNSGHQNQTRSRVVQHPQPGTDILHVSGEL
jgi:hypothetical protein